MLSIFYLSLLMALVSLVTNDVQLFCPIFYCVFSLSFFLVFGCFIVVDRKRYRPLIIIPFLFLNFGIFVVLFLMCFNIPSSQVFSIFFGHCEVDFSCSSFWFLSLGLIFILFFCGQSFGLFNRLFLFEIYVVFILSWVGIAVAIRATSFLVLFLGLELQAFSFYILVAIRRTSSISTERALKYFLLGAFSSGIFVFGVALIYNETGSFMYASINRYFWGSRLEYTAVVGVLLILRSLLFKLGSVPLHQWVPDVYEGRSSLVGAYFSTVPKFAIILILIRACQVPFAFLFEWWAPFLLFSALVSLLVGTFGALGQQKIKRFIAYSSIGHSGFLLLGLSVGTIESLFSVIFYSIFYLIRTLLLWLVLISFSKYVNKLGLYPKGFDFFGRSFSFYFSELGSLFCYNSPLSVLFLVSLLSTAGIPPFGGFISKFLVVFSLLSRGFFYPGFIVIITSIVRVFYYLRWVKIMFFDGTNALYMHYFIVFYSISPVVSLFLSFLGFVLLAYFIFPDPLLIFSQRFFGYMFEWFMLPVLKIGATLWWPWVQIPLYLLVC
jgi:NADH-quinone oxidoreductase subunit N